MIKTKRGTTLSVSTEKAALGSAIMWLVFRETIRWNFSSVQLQLYQKKIIIKFPIINLMCLDFQTDNHENERNSYDTCRRTQGEHCPTPQFSTDINDYQIGVWDYSILSDKKDTEVSVCICMFAFPRSFRVYFILCYFDQEWRRGGSYREGGERHQGEEDSQLSEEQDDWLFQ